MHKSQGAASWGTSQNQPLFMARHSLRGRETKPSRPPRKMSTLKNLRQNLKKTNLNNIYHQKMIPKLTKVKNQPKKTMSSQILKHLTTIRLLTQNTAEEREPDVQKWVVHEELPILNSPIRKLLSLL